MTSSSNPVPVYIDARLSKKGQDQVNSDTGGSKMAPPGMYLSADRETDNKIHVTFVFQTSAEADGNSARYKEDFPENPDTSNGIGCDNYQLSFSLDVNPVYIQTVDGKINGLDGQTLQALQVEYQKLEKFHDKGFYSSNVQYDEPKSETLYEPLPEALEKLQGIPAILETKLETASAVEGMPNVRAMDLSTLTHSTNADCHSRNADLKLNIPITEQTALGNLKK